MSAKPSVAFVGTGVMGRSMAGHLMAAGHPLHVYNRTRDKARALLDGGARWHDSAGAAAAESDLSSRCSGFPRTWSSRTSDPGGSSSGRKRGRSSST